MICHKGFLTYTISIVTQLNPSVAIMKHLKRSKTRQVPLLASFDCMKGTGSLPSALSLSLCSNGAIEEM